MKYLKYLISILVFAILVPNLVLAQTPIAKTDDCIITWNPNTEPDLGGYYVYQASDSATLQWGVPVDVPISSTPKTTCKGIGLTTSGLYDISVKARDTSFNLSDFSNIVKVQFTVTTPSPTPTPTPTPVPTGTVTVDRTSIIATVPANTSSWITTSKVTNGTSSPVTVTWSDSMSQLVDVRPNNTQTIASGATAIWEHKTSALSSGTYKGTGTLVGGGLNVSLPITITVGSVTPTPSPVLSILPATLSFTAVQGTTPASQSFNIANSGGGTLSWSITSNQSWMKATPTSGSSNSNSTPIAVSIDTTGLLPGNYTGNFTVTGTGATNSPQVVVVNLVISSPPLPPTNANTLFKLTPSTTNPLVSTFSVPKSVCPSGVTRSAVKIVGTDQTFTITCYK